MGNVEVHGGLSADCEYVGPLAFATKMAEETDGLVFPYLAYFFPGGTIELGSLMNKVKADHTKVLFGAYSVMGRLEDNHDKLLRT
jgi:hypothetical protein